MTEQSPKVKLTLTWKWKWSEAKGCYSRIDKNGSIQRKTKTKTKTFKLPATYQPDANVTQQRATAVAVTAPLYSQALANGKKHPFARDNASHVQADQRGGFTPPLFDGACDHDVA
ncbi:hypothetical protein MMC11_002683 [Xylographa trunciseda]|nr:hypothetical protein [Xylographa trunciseda]